MENLILILLGIAAAAYSAYRKNQTSKDSTTADSREINADSSEPQHEEESRESERDYVEEYFGEQDEPSSQKNSQPEIIQGQQRFRNPRLEEAYDKQNKLGLEDVDLPSKSEGKKVTKQNNYKRSAYDKQDHFQPEEKKRKTTTKYPGKRSKTGQHRFNLRQAIIYSEILNRKY
ncbi:MAG: hypothetical protein K9I68_12065 [Bacteroidales bacterium]|nr:hypothetical protein [Bacteroidales bacterium]